jgi:hypothetical protein
MEARKLLGDCLELTANLNRQKGFEAWLNRGFASSALILVRVGRAYSSIDPTLLATEITCLVVEHACAPCIGLCLGAAEKP